MTKPDIKSFNCGPLSFRLLEEGDLMLTLEWRNQDRVRSCLFDSNKIEYEDHLSWFKKYSEKEDDFTFIISERESGRLIGQIAIYGIVHETKSAEKGRSMIGDVQDLGKGYGQIATMAMVDFAFRQLGLNHLVANVKIDNHASIKINKRCGFSVVTVGDDVIELDIFNNRRSWERWDNSDVADEALSMWNQSGYNSYIQKIADIAMNESGDSWLDVGCGDGRLFSVADADKMVGLDNSVQLLAEAIHNNDYDNVRYQYGSVIGLPYDDDEFHTVTCFGTLPYIGPFFDGRLDEYQQAISELFRVATDTVIISVLIAEKKKINRQMVAGSDFSTCVIPIDIFREQVNRSAGNELINHSIVGNWSVYTFAKRSRPAHSVFVSSYNRPTMIKRALQSIKDQTVDDFEVIIVDDGSNDETIVSIMEEIEGDDRFNLLRYDGPADGEPRPNCAVRGVNRLNEAIPYAQGGLIHYLPDDDWFNTGRFEAFEELFTDEKVQIGYGRLIYVDSDGKPTGREQYPGKPIANPLSVMGQTQMVHRGSLFNVVQRWPTTNIDYAADGFFFKSLVDAGFGPIVGIDRVVSYNRCHPHNMLNTADKTTSEREEPVLVSVKDLSVSSSAGNNVASVKDLSIPSPTGTSPIRRAVCILGMHRSGMSAITRLINLLGVYLGPDEQLISKSHRNPLGFWERFDLATLNDHLLESIQRQWNDDTPINLATGLRDDKINQLKLFVESEFGGHEIWAWKDPRNCLLLRYWRDVLKFLEITLEYVFIFRNPISCARSMDKLHDVDCDFDRGLRMWVNYTLSAIVNLGPEERYIIAYSEALESVTVTADKISSMLELDRVSGDAFKEVHSWMQPQMRHYINNSPDLVQFVSDSSVCDPEFGSILLATYNLMVRGKANDLYLNSSVFVNDGKKLFDRYNKWIRSQRNG